MRKNSEKKERKVNEEKCRRPRKKERKKERKEN